MINNHSLSIIFAFGPKSIIIHPSPTHPTPSRASSPDSSGRVSLHFRDAEYCTVTEELSVRGVTQAPTSATSGGLEGAIHWTELSKKSGVHGVF